MHKTFPYQKMADSTNFFLPIIYQFFIGIYKENVLINLKKENWGFKKMVYILRAALDKRNPILFLCDENYTHYFSNLTMQGSTYFFSNWKNGLLTNYNFMRLSNYNDLTPLKIKPSLVIILKNKISKTLLDELYIKNIPNIYLSKETTAINGVTYSLPIDLTIHTISFFLWFFSRLSTKATGRSLRRYLQMFKKKSKKITLRGYKHKKQNAKSKTTYKKPYKKYKRYN